MMDSPFFRSHWNVPSRPLYGQRARAIPVQSVKTTPSPKVMSIPVHFVGSERSRSDSALKIQKLFRGFLVRKSVKKIAAIKREVDEIEKMISKKETVELIRKDSREKLRVNEMLMSLLFRLDSVRGVDSGVRDCRKAVIKKTIALQEAVDAIVAGDETLGANKVDAATDAVDQTPATQGNAPEIEHPVSDSNIAHNYRNCDEFACDQTIELQNHVESMRTLSESELIPEAFDNTKQLQVPEDSVDVAHENKSNVGEDVNEDKVIDENHDAGEFGEENLVTIQAESQSDSSGNPQSLVEGGEGEYTVKQEEGMEILGPVKDEGNAKEISGCGATGEDNQRSRELLERMMEDNEKMMGLMAEMYERNELQTRLLRSLSQRVEQLEKAFICERLRRKKKRQAGGTLDAQEKSPDLKKVGNR